MDAAVAKLLWQQREDIGPASRANCAMAYEASASRVILFGGGHWKDYVDVFNDTWGWDGDSWVQLADTGPSPRQLPRLAFDVDRQVIVLFGGNTPSGWLFDTWEWDGSAWTQIEDVGPGAETFYCDMAYDEARRLTLLSCGSVESGGEGTWTWDGSAWTQVDDGGPRRRDLTGLAYDPERNRAVLFGGGPWFGARYGDTWEWDGAVWKQAEDIGPPARSGHSIAWDGKSVLLFGGHGVDNSGKGRFLGDTWAWDGARWRQRQDIGPHPRVNHALAWDSARDRTVLFGGWFGIYPNDRIFGDTWEAFEKI